MTTNLHDYFQSNNKIPEIKTYCRGVLEATDFDFVSVTMEARRQLLEYASTKAPMYIRRNFMPDNMYCNMIGVLYELYPTLMNEDKEGCAYVKLAADIRFYPKKLNKRYLPGNQITKHVKSKFGQELYDEDTKIHVLYGGPVLEKEDWTLDFKGVYASYINEYYPKKAAFVIDLNDLAKPMSLGFENVEPQGPQTPLVRVAKKLEYEKERKAE